jgi:hypothetical protein
MANNFSAQKQVIKPPQRGIFPLDHDSECRPTMEKYLGCLTESDSDHYKCRQFSRAYLECRMENQLMATEDLNKVYIYIYMYVIMWSSYSFQPSHHVLLSIIVFCVFFWAGSCMY